MTTVTVEADLLHLPDGPVRLVHYVSELPSELTPWDYVYDEHARELQAVLNSASRLFSYAKDPDFLGTLALADCVSLFLMDEKKFTADQARDIRNQWLQKVATDR